MRSAAAGASVRSLTILSPSTLPLLLLACWLTVVAITFIIVLCNFCHQSASLRTHQEALHALPILPHHPKSLHSSASHLHPGRFSLQNNLAPSGCCNGLLFSRFHPLCHFQAHWLTVDFVACYLAVVVVVLVAAAVDFFFFFFSFFIRPVVHATGLCQSSSHIPEPNATHIFACILLLEFWIFF